MSRQGKERVKDLSSHPCTSKTMVLKNRGTEYLAVDPEAVTWLRTNDIGRFVLTKCDSKHTLKKIINKVAKECGVPVELVEEDIVQFVRDAREAGIILGDQNANEQKTKLESVTVNVTNQCNLRCAYCYYQAGNKLENEMNTETLQKVISELRQMKVKRIIISGGEPLYRDDIFEVLSGCEAETALATNGTLVNEKNAKSIAATFKQVQVSLDGPDQKTHESTRCSGTFDKVLSAISTLKRYQVNNINLAMVVTKKNITKVTEMVRFADELGCNLSLNRLIPIEKSADELNVSNVEYVHATNEAYRDYLSILLRKMGGQYKTLKQITSTAKKFTEKREPSFLLTVADLPYDFIFHRIPKKNCGLGVNQLSISPDGFVYPCHALHQEQHVLGDVKRESMASIYERSANKYGKLCVDDSIMGCQDCWLRHFCGGGCRARALWHTGMIEGRDPRCPIYASAIENAMWHKGHDADKFIKDVERQIEETGN